MNRYYEVQLPALFSSLLIHDGVPELGFIEDETRNYVTWSLTEREIFAMLSDAKDVLTRERYVLSGGSAFYHHSKYRTSAQKAIDTLEVFISANNLKFQVP
jgi:hypothetical protein